MSVDRTETCQWTIDYSLQVWAMAIPLALMFWLLRPVMAPGLFWLNTLLLLAVAIVAPILSRTTVDVSADGVVLTGFRRRYSVAWENVKTVTTPGPRWCLWPGFRLVLRDPADAGWLVGKRKFVGLALPNLPGTQVYGLLRQFLDEDRFDPRLNRVVARPLSGKRLAVLMLLEAILVLFWLTVIFWRWGEESSSTFSHILLPGSALAVLLSLCRQAILPYLRWYEPESKVVEAGNGLIHTAFPMLAMLFMVRILLSDVVSFSIVYLYFWALVAIETAVLLHLLAACGWRIPTPWAALLLLGFLFYPGQTLLWQSRHMKTVTVEVAPALGDRQSLGFPTHAVWPDGRVAVFVPLPEEGKSELRFLAADLTLVAKTTVPNGFLECTHGDWLFWVHTDSDKTRSWCYRRFGPDHECHQLDNIRPMPAARDAAVANTAFGYQGDPCGLVDLVAVDLPTSQADTILPAVDLWHACQTADDRFRWAEKTRAAVSINEWTKAGGARLVQTVPLRPGEAPAGLSPDLRYLIVSHKAGDGPRLLRLDDQKEWALPALGSSVKVRGEPPYLVCRGEWQGSYHVYKLLANGRSEELSIPGMPLGSVTFSPSRRVLLGASDGTLLGSRPVAYDFTTGQRRTLLLNPPAFGWDDGSSESLWAGESFCYLTWSLPSGRHDLVKLSLDSLADGR